jgi:hypothetical protein
LSPWKSSQGFWSGAGADDDANDDEDDEATAAELFLSPWKTSKGFPSGDGADDDANDDEYDDNDDAATADNDDSVQDQQGPAREQLLKDFQAAPTTTVIKTNKDPPVNNKVFSSADFVVVFLAGAAATATETKGKKAGQGLDRVRDKLGEK